MKTRSQKVICILACIFLLASFCVIPVSAAEVPTSVQTLVRIGDQPYIDSIAWASTTIEISPFDFLDNSDWYSLTRNNDDYVSGSRGFYDYPYLQYNIDKDPPQVPWYAMSFACQDNLISSQILDSSFRITGGKLRFFTSKNVVITDMRFSLRTYDSSLYRITDTVAVTDVFSVSHFSNTSTNDYDVQIGNLRFRYLSNSNILMKVVLCLEFKVVPIVLEKPVIFGIDEESEFSILQYTSATGPAEGPYYPELSDPFYDMPDSTIRDNMLLIDDVLLGSTGDFETDLEDIIGDYRVSLGDFKDGIQSVSVLLDYLVDDLPFFNHLLSFSLALGMLSLVFGILGSAVSAVSDGPKSSAVGSSSGSKSK